MVLTNFELWAADGVSNGSSNLPLDFVESNHHNRHLNPFDPRAVPQLNSNLTHLSSNGYYGFSYINSVHDNDNNNNNNNTSNINHNNNNNNNTTTYNFMTNDVNGMNNTQQQQQTHTFSANFGSSAYAAGHAVPVARCKKRFFVMNDNDVDAAVNANANNCTATNKNYYNNNYEVSAKRCRFDDDFSAQYCNDFFQLPSTQIATQSCLMDTEEGFENNNNNNNNNNIEKYEQSLNPQLQTITAPHQQQQHHQISQQQQQQQQPQQQHLYHQQQHYQDIIQFATIKCHFNHNNYNNNNYNNSCDTLALKNNHTTCKIDFEKNSENILKIHEIKTKNNAIQSENDKYDNNDDVANANDFKVDDATLFAQLHGGCLHHHHHRDQFYKTVSSRGVNTVTNNAVNHHHLQDENYYEEF